MNGEEGGRGLFSYRIEFALQCPRCDNPLPLDGPLDRAHCRSCQSDVEIPRDYWIETLGNSCRKAQELDRGSGTGSMLLGTFHGHLTLARFDPYCDRCKTDFDDPWKLVPGAVYVCTKCGARWPVQIPPPWLAEGVPRIRQLINALLTLEEDHGPGGSEARPVSVTCPSCSGHLEVDGEGRILTCSYCGGQVYVPDQLWIRMHGAVRKRRWFVVCEYSDDGE